jgi:hypothetical protein
VLVLLQALALGLDLALLALGQSPGDPTHRRRGRGSANRKTQSHRKLTTPEKLPRQKRRRPPSGLTTTA